MGFDSFPIVIGWELTLACNLRCKHCASSAGSSRDAELSTDEALAICDQLPELLVREVNFTGGEPLLRNDWPIIAARLRDLGIIRKMVTNGLTLDADTVARMKDVGMAAIGVSVDGLESTHDTIRAYAGHFRKITTGIEQTLAAGIPVCAITAVNAMNIDELPSVLEMLLSMGVPNWQIQPLFPLGRGAHSAGLHISEQDYLRFGAILQQCRARAAGTGLTIDPADSCGYFTELGEFDEVWQGCTAGLISCGIMSDGKIKGCLSMPDELIEGDLRKNDLWDIWFHPDAFAYTRKFTLADLGPACQSCEMAEQCQGGCSAMSYGSTGQFHNDPYCFTGIRKRSQVAVGV